MAASLIDSQDIDTMQALGRHDRMGTRHVCFLFATNSLKLQFDYILLRTCLPRTPDNRSMRKKGGAIRADGGFKSQAGGGLVGLFALPRGRGAHSAPFLSSGDTGGVPFGGAAFPRLPQRPYHWRAVLRGHGAGPAHTRRAAVYRVLH